MVIWSVKYIGSRRRLASSAATLAVSLGNVFTFPSESFFIAVARRIRISTRENFTHSVGRRRRVGQATTTLSASKIEVILVCGGTLAGEYSALSVRRAGSYIVNSGGAREGRLKARASAGAGGKSAGGGGREAHHPLLIFHCIFYSPHKGPPNLVRLS